MSCANRSPGASAEPEPTAGDGVASALVVHALPASTHSIVTIVVRSIRVETSKNRATPARDWRPRQCALESRARPEGSVLPSSKLGAALRYMLNHYVALGRFLTDGVVPIARVVRFARSAGRDLARIGLCE